MNFSYLKNLIYSKPEVKQLTYSDYIGVFFLFFLIFAVIGINLADCYRRHLEYREFLTTPLYFNENQYRDPFNKNRDF